MFSIITPSDLTKTIVILTMIGCVPLTAASFYLLMKAKTRKDFYTSLMLIVIYGSLLGALFRLWIEP